jgi:hypothetical protein
MKQNLSRYDDGRSADEEIPHLLWIPKDHYHAHTSSPLGPVLSWLNPVCTLTHFCKIRLNIIRT